MLPFQLLREPPIPSQAVCGVPARGSVADVQQTMGCKAREIRNLPEAKAHLQAQFLWHITCF